MSVRDNRLGVPAAGNTTPTLSVEIPAHRRSTGDDRPVGIQLRQRQFMFTLVINSVRLESLFIDKVKRISNL